MSELTISASDYKIMSAIISTDRLGTFEFDVTSSIVDLQINEDMSTLGLHGNVTILDDANLLAVVDFQGTEYIHLEMSLQSDVQRPLKKTFLLSELETSQKGNDQSEILIFTLESVEDYLNSLTNVNKSYDGTPAEIIQKIAKDSFGLEKEVKTNNKLFQGNMRVIIPNWSPFKAMRWIADRSTSDLGLPYFLYSVLGDDKIRFLDLQTLLEGQPLNSIPYRYNQGAAQNLSDQNVSAQQYNIKSYQVNNTENTVGIADAGGISGEYRFIDTTTFQDNKFNYNIKDVYKKLAKNSNLFNEGKTPNLDTEFKIKDKRLDEFNTIRVTQIGTSKVYSDIASYHENMTPADHSQKAKSMSYHKFIQKSAMEIVIPGLSMYYSGGEKFSNVSIGNLIDVEFLDNEPKQAGATLSENAPDGKRSGIYLIAACKHMIQNNQGKFKYDCVLRILKLANRDGMTVIPT